MIKFWWINAMRGYDLTSVPQTLEALQNTFILIYRCEICPYYAYILFTWKSKCPRGCCFFTWQYFLISYYFHRFSCNRVAVNLDPTVLLVWNGSIAEKSFVYFFDKIYFYKYQNALVFKFWKFWLYELLKTLYFPNEIKNSVHSNEKILRLKQ